MHFTRKEFVEYILHLKPKMERSDAEKKADTFLRWVAKRRKIRDLPTFQRDDLEPKRDTNIKWPKGPQVIEELKAIEKSLSDNP